MTELPPGTTTLDVRIYEVATVESTRPGGKATYRLRWKTAGRKTPHSRNYVKKTAATARRAQLVAALTAGTAFHIETGLPVTEYLAQLRAEAEKAAAEQRGPSWFDHASAFVAMKAPESAPGHRRNLAEALATITPAFYDTDEGRPPAATLRKALYSWAFRPWERYRPDGNGGQVEQDPPEHLAEAMTWLAAHTIQVEAIDATVARAAVDLAGRKKDGTAAASSTAIRRRSALYSALDFAAERKHLADNPLNDLQWARPKTADQVDRRSVVNHAQARQLLAAVGEVSEGRYRRMKIFFACMYYSGLRPEEVNGLTKPGVILPDEADADGWGEFLLEDADPEIGGQWTDSGEREARGLKHRPQKDTRSVPIPPPLVTMIRDHIAEFGWAPDGHLVRGVRGGPVPTGVYGEAFRAARKAAFTAEQQASPLARRPYDLRHACLSGWLNAGVPATQVAEWAGHSLQMLYSVYAKCVDGQDEVARKRIAAALAEGMEG